MKSTSDVNDIVIEGYSVERAKNKLEEIISEYEKYDKTGSAAGRCAVSSYAHGFTHALFLLRVITDKEYSKYYDRARIRAYFES